MRNFEELATFSLLPFPLHPRLLSQALTRLSLDCQSISITPSRPFLQNDAPPFPDLNPRRTRSNRLCELS